MVSKRNRGEIITFRPGLIRHRKCVSEWGVPDERAENVKKMVFHPLHLEILQLEKALEKNPNDKWILKRLLRARDKWNGQQRFSRYSKRKAIY